jgi:hypothetical protein
MEEMIPENHLLRLVDKHIDLSFIRAKVKGEFNLQVHQVSKQ